mmetsp:Transcript_3317/g.5823  ORF Transcript_3317/g.5823 Transcript_3317/m.5823 type:complete len:80 (+) Transcript_3317:1322-1561(+)
MIQLVMRSFRLSSSVHGDSVVDRDDKSLSCTDCGRHAVVEQARFMLCLHQSLNDEFVGVETALCICFYFTFRGNALRHY